MPTVAQCSSRRKLQIVVLPPMRWDVWDGSADPTVGPGAPRPADDMEERVINPHEWPWNPLAGRHPLFEGLDPLRALRVLIGRRRCDAVLAVFESPVVFLLLLRRLFRFKPPVVMLDIGLSGGWRIRERIQNFIVPRVDAIIVLGRNQIEHIQQRWPTAKMVHFVYSRVDTEFYSPQPFEPNGPIFTVGDDPGRDFPTLVRAIQGLDRPVVAKTRQIEGSPPGVKVIRGRLSHPDYRTLFREARFVVIPLRPTVNAGGVSAVLEAMAMGRAVIVSASAGIADYVMPEQTALVVPPEDPEALRAAIERLLGDDELCRRLGAAGRAFAELSCSHAANGARLAEILREVVGR